MIESWFVYGIVVGGLVAGAGWLLESALRVRGLPARGIWLGALAIGVAFTFTAPQRAPRVTIPVDATTVAPPGTVSDLDVAIERGSDLLTTLMATIDPRIVMLAWGIGAAVLLAVLGLTILRARLVRKRWPRVELLGDVVRVAPVTGPLVAGVIRPEIVVPRWLLSSSETEQHLVMAHEREHVNGRDPLMLTMGCVLVALLPWSPAAWWMLSRLRLAVELDCDRRVVQGGANRSEYGTVLLDVASRTERRFSFAPALLEGPSQLERRLVTMTNQIPRFSSARALLLSAGAALLMLVACEAELPTSTQIEEMDVATAEAALVRLEAAQAGKKIAYRIDGEAVTEVEAKALPADHIATVEIMKVEGAEAKSQISILTKKSAVAFQETGQPRKVAYKVETGPASEVAAMEGFEGILVLDGVIIESLEFGKLDPDEIQSIEIIKGEAAARLYASPRAQNGVIHITTKAGAKAKAGGGE